MINDLAPAVLPAVRKAVSRCRRQTARQPCTASLSLRGTAADATEILREILAAGPLEVTTADGMTLTLTR